MFTDSDGQRPRPSFPVPTGGPFSCGGISGHVQCVDPRRVNQAPVPLPRLTAIAKSREGKSI